MYSRPGAKSAKEDGNGEGGEVGQRGQYSQSIHKSHSNRHYEDDKSCVALEAGGGSKLPPTVYGCECQAAKDRWGWETSGAAGCRKTKEGNPERGKGVNQEVAKGG